jgi:tripartite-type tricarboxylate transporter receptor subunit TctC
MRSTIASVLVALFLVPPAIAQDYPSQPVKVIVPYAAGGGTDIAARIVTEQVAADLNQSFVVDNRPGGGTVIGTQAIATAKPDGYTIGFVDPAFTINPTLVKKLPYDTEKDFIPVILVTTSSTVLAINGKAPHKDVAGFSAYLKSNPAKANFASPGRGSAGHLAAEQFKIAIAAEIAHVPYRGGAPALQDLLAGQVDFLFVGPNSLLSLIGSGQIRALAITGQRSPLLPDVPTFSEAGLPQVDAHTFAGLLAPAGTPSAIVAKLQAAYDKAIKSPRVRQRLAELALNPIGGDSKIFADYIANDVERWRKVITAAKIEPEQPQ